MNPSARTWDLNEIGMTYLTYRVPCVDRERGSRSNSRSLAMTKSETVNKTSISRAISVGVLGGVVGSIAMAMYAMTISNFKDTGFFTPLYHIASSITSGKAMMTSMTQAADGSSGYFDLGPATVGAIVHMMTGAIAGAVFGVIISKIWASRAITVAAGTIHPVKFNV